LSANDERLSARYWPFLLVLALFFLSGASGLVYQVIWVRLLTRVFGTTTFAVSALLAAFMAGLGLGAALASRYLVRTRHPLRWFGALEIGIGLYALGLNAVLPAGEQLFLGLVSQLGLSLHGENLAKVALSFIVLLPPTTLMGASLPLLVRQCVHHMSSVGLRTGSLYAINTFGAALGCFLAGFYTIPLWGMESTTQIAATVNSLVGIAAIALSFVLVAPAPETSSVAPTTSRTTSRLRWAVAAFTISGFAALGLEVVWTRLLTLVFKGYSYSFTAMLTVFLLGIALGSVAFANRADRSKDPEALLGLLQIAIGITVTAFTALLIFADGSRALLQYSLGYDFAGQTLATFLIALIVLGVPTFLFGAQFPVVSRLATDEAHTAGRRVGLLYAMNIVGSILGALIVGYVLIPLAGTQASLRLLAGSMIAMGAALVLRRSALATLSKRAVVVGAVAFMAAAIVVTPRDLSLQLHRQWLQGDEVIEYYEEGASATVMVAGSRETGARRILVNGSSASNSSTYGLSVNRVQGSIPFFFDRLPKRVLAACFGTGVTFGTLGQFDIEHMDGVDISPEVIRAAGTFSKENYDVVNNDRVTIHIDDGRNFLLKSREKYDVITMEPMPPALAGVSDMYTKEFYDLCKERLNPGGMVSQWVPMYYLTLDDMKMLYRTFADAFPHVMVFYHNFDTFLVGSSQPLRLSPDAFRQRLVSERLTRDLEAIQLLEPEDLFSAYLMGRDAVVAFAGDAPLVTDDLPFVEFSAPKAVELSVTATNYLGVTAFGESVAPLVEGVVSDELYDTLVERFDHRNALWKSARERSADRAERAQQDQPPPGMIRVEQ
jgi:spermidine synthase